MKAIGRDNVIFAFIIICGIIYNTSSQDCDCVTLTDCQPYMRLLRSNNTPATRKEIFSSICETTYSTLKVCCPSYQFARTNFFPSNCGRSPMGEKVIGGIETHIGEFPWMAAIGYKADVHPDQVSFNCGGSVINSRYILTAAHCIHSNFTKGFKIFSVRLGEWNFSSTVDCLPPDRFSDKTCAPATTDIEIEESFLHPNFNIRKKLSDDIAVIRLKQSINFDDSEGFLEPICFPTLGLNAEFEANGEDVLAAGWGRTENQPFSEIMLKVYLPFAGAARCSVAYPRRFTDFQLCVGGQFGKDTCLGDSGGPLMLSERGEKFMLVGLVSYGKTGCRGVDPAVYVSVSDYRDWIEGVMKPW